MGQLDKFDIVIRRQGGKVVAGIPQLYLFAKGEDIPAALNELENKRRYIESSLVEGDLDTIDAATTVAASSLPAQAGGLRKFAAKAAILVGSIAFAVVAIGIVFLIQIENRLEKIGALGGGAFWAKAENELARLADPKNDLTPARKERLLAYIRAIGDRWRPFVIEIGHIFNEPDGRSRAR